VQQKKPPLTSPATKANGDHSEKGYENTSIDMTLDIVGITEMQKCGVCNPHSESDWRIKKAEPKFRIVLGNLLVKGSALVGLLYPPFNLATLAPEESANRILTSRI
jgi:hypothetical protein